MTIPFQESPRAKPDHAFANPFRAQFNKEKMQMHKLLITAGLAVASLGTLTAIPALAETPAAAPLSVETTDLGTLMDNPAAKAVLTKHIPLIINNDQIAAARSLTLRQLQQFTGDALPNETLTAIQSDLDKLPK